jgi:hypothetical protein
MTYVIKEEKNLLLDYVVQLIEKEIDFSAEQKNKQVAVSQKISSKYLLMHLKLSNNIIKYFLKE